MFAVWGIEALALGQLARTGIAEEARRWLVLRRRTGPFGGASMVTLLVTGLALMRLRGGPEAWTVAALVEVALMMATGLVVERRWRPRWAATLAGGAGAVGNALRTGTRTLLAALRFRLAGGVAILALMTLKPGQAGSLAMLASGIVVGAALAIRSAPRRTAAVA